MRSPSVIAPPLAVLAAVLTIPVIGCDNTTPEPTPVPKAVVFATPTPEPPPQGPPAGSVFRFPLDSDRFEPSVRGLTKYDAVRKPPKGAVVFVGSSTMENWKTLPTDFPNIKTINRGISAINMAATAYFAYNLVTPYEPKTVVVYAGDNDLEPGYDMTPEYILSAFQELVRLVRSKCPDARIIAISIKPSPARWDRKDKQREVNRLLKKYIASGAPKNNMVFVDSFDHFLGADGKPRPELYTAEQVHLSPEGYAILVKDLRPYLE